MLVGSRCVRFWDFAFRGSEVLVKAGVGWGWVGFGLGFGGV